ncbi:hypothetical protein B0H19DRAFT_17663 [Mycena capillaripes]|nr:hypothetical protein B0H19DRAFT_17663 [Mycena capillaripes]
MVFQGVNYHLSSSLPEERHSQLEELLTAGHATRADSVFEATHIITNSEAFEGWQDIDAQTVAVVSDLWVERSVAANKMQLPGYYSASRSKLFSGVIACSADLHPSDEEVVSVGITALGGQWRMGLTKDVTHLFAVTPTSERYSTGMGYRDQTHVKVLVPDWFDDTVLLGKHDLSTATYEWPDPAVLNRRLQSPTQLKKIQRSSMSPQKKALYSTSSLDPSEPQLASLDSKDVWAGRHILLSTSLNLAGSRRKIVEDGIRKAKGVPVKYSTNNGDGTMEEELRLVAECDVLVTRYRSGPVFFKAWRAAKTIGTLSWLLNVQVTAVYSSPRDQILHFPTPPTAVEGFDKHVVSVTNYAGETRDYLKKLITLMGGNFTPTLSTKNTALVAAQMSGTKTAKAADWSIPVVNHIWLEDCFLRWQNLTPAVSKYVSYPAGVDFPSIVGDRGVGPDIEEIIAAEAEKEGEHIDGADDSQASADETEVEGGLMPAIDMDVDVDVDFGGGGDDVDFVENHDDRMSFEEDEPPQRVAAAPSTPKSATKSPLKPKSASKKHIRGLSTSSESQFDPEIKKKVIHVVRPASMKKATPKKSRETDEESEEEEEPVSRPARRNLVRRVSSPAPRRSSRKAPDSHSQPARKSSVPAEDSDSDDGPTLRRSPRKAPDSSSKRPTIRERSISVEHSDSDEPPDVLALFSRTQKTPVAGKAARTPPPKKLPAAKKSSPLKPATPTPPSSPLSALVTPSPKVVKRIPTKTVSVVVPNVKNTSHASLSVSTKKAPPGRTESVAVVSNHRASASAPPRSRQAKTAATRASSPASSIAASSVVAAEHGGRAKRSAATLATQRLHDEIMPDVIKFENEKRSYGRKSRRVPGRTETEDDDEDEQPSTKRRKLDGGRKGRASTSSDETGLEEPPPKAKARKSEVALRDGKPIKLMTTGTDLSDEVLKTLARLGAKVTNRATECTHLVVPKIVRTEKFLSALAGAPFILTREWAVDSAAADALMPEEDYLLQDDAGDSKYNFSLTDAVSRAKTLKGKLFEGHTFYVTAKVPALSILRNVILANGGQTVTSQPSLRILETNTGRHVISCPEDAAMWRQIAVAHPIYSNELVLTSALRQEIDWDDERFRVPGSVQ